MKHILGQDEDFNIIPYNNELFPSENGVGMPVIEFSQYLFNQIETIKPNFITDEEGNITQLKNTKSPIMVVDYVRRTTKIHFLYPKAGICILEIFNSSTQDYTVSLVKVRQDGINFSGSTIEDGITTNMVYYSKENNTFYYYGGQSVGLFEISPRNPHKTLSTVSAPSSGTTYTITPFVYSVLNPTTSTVDIALSSQTDNTVDYEYTLEINGSDITTNNVTAINFPSTLVWEENSAPDINDFLNSNYTAWIIEIRNGKYASYKRYKNE